MDHEEGGAAQSPRAVLVRLFPVLLLNLTAFGVAIPILPALVKAAGGTGVDVGAVFAAQSVGQLMMAPLWGRLSDRVGRRPILLVTILCALLLDVLTAHCTTLGALFAARFVYGLCAGTITTASALVADATDAKSRSKGMAIIGISFGLGFTIGPALGAGASALGMRMGGAELGAMARGFPFLVSATVNGLALLLALGIVREASAAFTERAANRAQRRPESLRGLLQRPPLAQMCGFFLVYSISVAILETTFFLYMRARYGFDERQVGMCFAGMGLLAAVVQGGVGRISARIGDLRMTLLGVALLSIGLTVATAWEQLVFLLSWLAIAAIGRALLQPGGLSIGASLAQDDAETGKVMGVLQSAQSAGRVLGPVLGGVLFDHLSPRAPFLGAGVLLAIMGVWWWRVFATPRVAASAR